MKHTPALLAWLASAVLAIDIHAEALKLVGVTVTPHVQSTELRYRRKTDFSLGARVQLFLRNQGKEALRFDTNTPVRLRGKTPDELLAADEWAWHDFPSAWTNEPLVLPPGGLTVWSFNGKRAPWGVGTVADLVVGDSTNRFAIQQPQAWLSAVTFLGEAEDPRPDSMVFHVANETGKPLRLFALRFFLPETNDSWRVLQRQPPMGRLETFPSDGAVPAGDHGVGRIATGPLPPGYGAVSLLCINADDTLRLLWAHLRIKREAFDLSGGWVASGLGGSNTLQCVPYLKTLRGMHVNTGMHQAVAGYTDNEALYSRYPLKYMNRCQPFEQYDTDAVLPRIHAVEFLGEPQYGGGRPVPPMDVRRAFAAYQRTRLPTSVTHSEERIWRFYAGLSDYPHYDAYRVTAPAADSWRAYDRWGGERIRWGAPLETIGDLTRSLRELNRPMPIAYWSQGAHSGWRGFGRPRTSPTPDELRVQAYHALSSRITSLYWFNLSLKSLLRFPDLIEPIARVNREVRLLEDFYLEGDAYHYGRMMREGKPDWDLAVVAGPRGALLFALDLDYQPDPQERVFRFGPPREASLSWPVPAYLDGADTLARVDADAVVPVPMKRDGRRVQVKARCGPVNVFVLVKDAEAIAALETRRRELVAFEESFDFDPAGRPEDLAVLQAMLDGDAPQPR